MRQCKLRKSLVSPRGFVWSAGVIYGYMLGHGRCPGYQGQEVLHLFMCFVFGRNWLYAVFEQLCCKWNGM
jgi:hypothetical protein